MNKPKNKDVQGNFASPLSLKPLKEAGKLANHLVDYLEEHKKSTAPLFLKFIQG